MNNLDNTIRQNSGFGDVAVRQFGIPGYEKICFVDLNDLAVAHAPTTNLCNPSNDYDPVICDGWKDRTQRVFLVPPAPTPLDIWNVTVDGDGDGDEDTSDCPDCYYECFDIADGKLNLKLDGKGDHVMISRAD